MHELYARGGKAVPLIQPYFEEAVVEGAINRTILSKLVLSDPNSLRKLEEIIHPLVADERRQFMENARLNNQFAVIYDVPLLLENHQRNIYDYVIVVTASSETQRRRVLSREGMTIEKFESIHAKQLPDSIKREQADFVINTDFAGFTEARAQVAKVLESIILRSNEAWQAWLHTPHPHTTHTGTDGSSLFFHCYMFSPISALPTLLLLLSHRNRISFPGGV